MCLSAPTLYVHLYLPNLVSPPPRHPFISLSPSPSLFLHCLDVHLSIGGCVKKKSSKIQMIFIFYKNATLRPSLMQTLLCLPPCQVVPACFYWLTDCLTWLTALPVSIFLSSSYHLPSSLADTRLLDSAARHSEFFFEYVRLPSRGHVVQNDNLPSCGYFTRKLPRTRARMYVCMCVHTHTRTHTYIHVEPWIVRMRA